MERKCIICCVFINDADWCWIICKCVRYNKGHWRMPLTLKKNTLTKLTVLQFSRLDLIISEPNVQIHIFSFEIFLISVLRVIYGLHANKKMFSILSKNDPNLTNFQKTKCCKYVLMNHKSLCSSVKDRSKSINNLSLNCCSTE